MSLYKYNITVKVDDEDDKYNEMTIRLGIKNAIQRHLRHSSLHNNNVKNTHSTRNKHCPVGIYHSQLLHNQECWNHTAAEQHSKGNKGRKRISVSETFS